MNSHSIHHLMQQGLRENVFPGAVLLVGSGDTRLFFEAYGKANLFSDQPMIREAVFDLASLTKPLATTLAVAHRWHRPVPGSCAPGWRSPARRMPMDP